MTVLKVVGVLICLLGGYGLYEATGSAWWWVLGIVGVVSLAIAELIHFVVTRRMQK